MINSCLEEKEQQEEEDWFQFYQLIGHVEGQASVSGSTMMLSNLWECKCLFCSGK